MTVSRPSALGRSLRAHEHARQVAMNDARRELGIGELDARALLFIADHPGTRATQLRDYLGITSAGVTILVDRLVQRGAARRDVDPSDRRVNHLTATVDLGAAPWDALTRFERDLEAAIAAQGDGGTDEFARLLAAVTPRVGT